MKESDFQAQWFIALLTFYLLSPDEMLHVIIIAALDKCFYLDKLAFHFQDSRVYIPFLSMAELHSFICNSAKTIDLLVGSNE